MLSSPAHADDVTLLTAYKTGMNDMAKMAVAYGRKWRYSFNTDKTIFLCWGDDPHPHIPVTFDNEVLHPKKEGKHMGVTLTTDKKLIPEIYQKRIGKGKYPILAGLGLGGSQVRTSPNTLSKIYWAVSIPKMLYGLEVTPIDESSIDLLENSHRDNARLIQNLPDRTPKPAPVMMIGWQSIGAVIAYMKIMFLIRVLCLSPGSLYRKMMMIGIEMYEARGAQRIKTPVCDMMIYVDRYRLNDIVEHCKAAGNWKMIQPLKKKIKTIILKCDNDLMKASCLLYRNLGTLIDSVNYKKLHVWWKCVAYSSHSFKSVSCVVALLCGTQPSGYGVNFGSRRRCLICCDYVTESIEHIIFECSGLQVNRQTLVNELVNSMPLAMRESFMTLNNRAKATFIISGLGSATHIPEWQDIYLKASRLIHMMYRDRAVKYKNLDV